MSNCVIFALTRWFRGYRYGWYLSIRKSNYGWWPHMLVTLDRVNYEDYQPLAPNHHLKFPPPLYRGYVRHTKVEKD
jgi:hypothetical protein